MPLEIGVWSKVQKTETCWLWTGKLTKKGYARYGLHKPNSYAHIASYEEVNGVVPEGLELDHLCRVRHCVNPSHLEAVTHLENIRRGKSPSAFHRVKSHCYKGHPFNSDNTIVNEKGWRVCITCKRESGRQRMRAFRARQVS